MRIKHMAPATLICLSLSGCMGLGSGEGAQFNRSLDSVHQPTVQISSFVYDADAASGTLSPVELRRVQDWFDAMNVRYGDRIAIDDASGTTPRPARDALAILVAQRGMLLSSHAPITTGAIAPGYVRIVLTRSSASVAGCPDWGTRSAALSTNNTTSNYGCATNANLASMVADATDLVRGQSSTTNDPLQASKAIGAFRAAPPTGAEGLVGSGTSGGSGGSSGGGR
jgi:pilus assembly protein CpaD